MAEKTIEFRYANLGVYIQMNSRYLKKICAYLGITKDELNELLSGYARPSWDLCRRIRSLTGMPAYDLLTMNQNPKQPNEKEKPK